MIGSLGVLGGVGTPEWPEDDERVAMSSVEIGGTGSALIVVSAAAASVGLETAACGNAWAALVWMARSAEMSVSSAVTRSSLVTASAVLAWMTRSTGIPELVMLSGGHAWSERGAARVSACWLAEGCGGAWAVLSARSGFTSSVRLVAAFLTSAAFGFPMPAAASRGI